MSECLEQSATAIQTQSSVSLSSTPEHVAKLKRVQDVLLQTPQIEVKTEHLIHGGIYTRTLRMKPGCYVMGAHYKVPTTVVLSGTVWAHVRDGWQKFEGYNVAPASAGRKQIFVTPPESTEDAVITMSFRTDAKTVEEAENQMTDESELLMSRKSDNDSVVITGE